MLLSPDQRTVVVARHITQLSYEDIAEALGLPEKTVKSRLHSARERLREHLLRREVI